MCKVRSTCKDWDFVYKGTDISVVRLLIEYFTPLTLGEEHQGDLLDEDVTEVWLKVKSEKIIKVRRTKGGAKRHRSDEKEVEMTFCLSRPDDCLSRPDDRDILLRHEINRGETTCTPCQKRGDGWWKSHRTAFGQGKRVVRDHEDVWDKCIGRTKNHFQVRWSTVVRA
jgi:hypothetical protein